MRSSPQPDVGTCIVLTMPLAEAQQLSEGIADLLCWVRGFIAACPSELDRHPMGVEETRELRIALRQSIARARGEAPPAEDMPF